ncbi:MAG: glycine-rich domain-containing protein [Terriglobales bacterium]
MALSVPDAFTGAFEALDYEAPFVIEKLVKERFVDTVEDASALFTEVKRYLVLCHVDRTKTWKMDSLSVDEAWHQFVLFTAEYSAFCTKYFGRYRHHAPSNSPPTGFAHAPEATLAEFGDRYREIFGIELPQVWYDAGWVTPRRRVVNYFSGKWVLGSVDGMVDLMDGEGRVLLSVSALAEEALRFIANTGAFYVREVPGDLTEEEKVALVSALVELKVLRVG